MRNPGIFRNDLTLSKNFNFGEKLTMNIKAEAYNFTNSRLSTGFSSTNVTSVNFLRVLSSADERQFRTPARRPKYSVLRNERMRGLGLAPMPELEAMVASYLQGR